MNPDSDHPIELTFDEAIQLAAHMVSQGYRKEAVDVFTRVTYDAVMAAMTTEVAR